MEQDYANLVEWIQTNPDAALLPVAFMIGKLVKSKLPVDNNYIPLIVIGSSALFGFLIGGIDLNATIKGAVAGLVAVGGHQIVTKTIDVVKKN